MTSKKRGPNPGFVVNDEVSGADMVRVSEAINRLEGNVGKTAEKLMVSWSAEEIVRAHSRTPSCTCLAPEATINVHPDAAYALARKSPQRTAAEAGVTALAANHGGVVPLHMLGKILGPWDSLIEELIPRRRG
jgi:hypothetical protein